eukprot:7205054-Prymnesium_polylepis.1
MPRSGAGPRSARRSEGLAASALTTVFVETWGSGALSAHLSVSSGQSPGAGLRGSARLHPAVQWPVRDVDKIKSSQHSGVRAWSVHRGASCVDSRYPLRVGLRGVL